MKAVIYIADPEILTVPIFECDEPLVDIKNYKDLFYGSPPECELTASCYTKMRATVFEKLCMAQKMLPKGLRFILYEGCRSLKVQQFLFEQEFNRVKHKYSLWSHADKFRETTRRVSPVTNLDGTKNVPPHNTGAAVDIEIITADGSLLDMGMTIKDWTNVDPEICLTNCDPISKIAKDNRKLLLDVLQGNGFINCPTEWWHFSYGDRYWAYHQINKQAIYGSSEDYL